MLGWESELLLLAGLGSLAAVRRAVLQWWGSPTAAALGNVPGRQTEVLLNCAGPAANAAAAVLVYQLMQCAEVDIVAAGAPDRAPRAGAGPLRRGTGPHHRTSGVDRDDGENIERIIVRPGGGGGGRHDDDGWRRLVGRAVAMAGEPGGWQRPHLVGGSGSKVGVGHCHSSQPQPTPSTCIMPLLCAG